MVDRSPCLKQDGEQKPKAILCLHTGAIVQEYPTTHMCTHACTYTHTELIHLIHVWGDR